MYRLFPFHAYFPLSLNITIVCTAFVKWCNNCVSGDVGGLYPSAIQAVLPRLLLAAAPPGSSGVENRRQCLKASHFFPDVLLYYSYCCYS